MTNIDRRQFLKNMGMIGGGVLLATSPWFSAFSEQKHTKGNKIRIGIIGTGYRGQQLLQHLANNPKVEIAALCDTFKPSLDKALAIASKAKTYTDCEKLIDDKSIDAVIIATPLKEHYSMIMDAFEANKHVFCESALAYSMEETHKIYRKFKKSEKVFFSGLQRLFDPNYIKAIEMVHSGKFGSLNGIRTSWHCFDDWKMPVPANATDKQINWRLYRDSSKGILSEVACHQLQIGTWAMREIPMAVMGHGALTHWNDKNREVWDNVTGIYTFENGVKLNFDAILFQKFSGIEEQLLCEKGIIEPEKNKYFDSEISQKPAILKLKEDISNILNESEIISENRWLPKSVYQNIGHNIGENTNSDESTSLMLEAFVEAVITEKQPPKIAEEAYYATQLSLLGHQAMKEEKMLLFPETFKIDYLNHASEI